MNNNESDHEYFCSFCKYSTKKIKLWNKHLKTKKHKKHNTGEININIKKHDDIDFNYKCEKCNFYSNNPQSWYQHKKTKKHIKYIKNKPKKIKNENIHEQHIIPQIITNNITNNVNNITTHNNITFNNYGNEKLNVIDINTFKEIINLEKTDPEKALKLLLEYVYIKTPENRNVRYLDLKSNYCKVLTENGYMDIQLDKIFDERTDKIIYELPIPTYEKETYFFNEIRKMKESHDELLLVKPLKRNYEKDDIKEYIKELNDYHENIKNKKKYKKTKEDFFQEIYQLEYMIENEEREAGII